MLALECRFVLSLCDSEMANALYGDVKAVRGVTDPQIPFCAEALVSEAGGSLTEG